MKILAIRGQNLASLARSFAVELAQSPLADAGLFAITGPVGAGKSTLLDAMCLALFDRTPRLSGSGGAPVGDDERAQADWLRANDPRSLLRRDAAEGYAEVDFVGRDGVVYRARWSVRRARRKADGRVQKQELLLTEPGRDLVIASGLRTEVLAAIRQRLGLDFQQFCRSVLLAQGEFHAFLRAGADERAKLLETLTGASIYRRLSKAAHERRRDGEKDVVRLREQVTQCAVLPSEQRAALEATRRELEQRAALCKAAVEAAQRHVGWYQVAEQLHQEESEAVVALQAARQQVAAAATRRQELERRLRALAVAGRWEVVQEARARLHKAEEAVAVAAKALTAANVQHDLAVQQLAHLLQAQLGVTTSPSLVEELPRWRSLLERLDRVEAEGRRVAAALPAATRTVEQAAQRRDAGQRLLAPLEQQLATAREAVERDLAEGATDAAAAAERAAVRNRLSAERKAWHDVERTRGAWLQLVVDHRERSAHHATLEKARVRALAALDHEVEDLVAAEKAARDRREALAGAERQHGLAGLRAELRDGEPCPLCGALEHPAAVPAHGVDLAILRLDTAAAEARLEALRVGVNSRQAAVEAAHQASEAEAATLRTLTQRVAAALAALRQALAAVGTIDGEGEVAGADPGEAGDAWLRERFARLDASERDLAAADARAAMQAGRVRQAIGEQVAAEQRLRQVRSDLDAAERSLRDAKERLAGEQRDADRALQQLAELRRELAEACDDEALALRVESLGASRATILARLHDACGSRREARRAVDEAAVRHAAALEALAERRDAAATADQALARALADNQVAEQDVASACRLGAQALHDEGAALRALDDEVVRLRAVVQERAKRRQAHERHDRPMLDKADALAALEQIRAERAAVDQERERVQLQLAVDDTAKQQLGALLPKVEAAEQQLAVWVALDDLIGSSGGDAFAVFAQGLTLDLLLLEANRRLAELARRYRLERIGTGELDFVVVDLDMGGNRRSLWSLSGGETFLVSLALALALATLAAEHSRVETLFLDEGFGTLDAQNLEVALAALDSLQATGCQVGVISHVDGFAERIGAVVEIRPEGSGQSRVVVPAR